MTGTGGFLFTYIPSNDVTEEKMNTEYYSKLDIPAIMKCVLLG